MSLFKVFKQRWFLVFIALVLLSLVIWHGGPYLALGQLRPFETIVGRLIGILVLVVLWTFWVQVVQFRARRAGDQLAKDVSAQNVASKERGRETPSSAEAVQLRARFDEAIASLRESKGKAVNLYELPWYIIIGPPGAGKTTAIANSGLNFPLSKKFGKEALRGVGGTRNCDWWFTDEAILLDTAGRYTTQDSDSESDQAGWVEFLTLLRKHRGRRPINGVLVAISASDLLSATEQERRRHVEAVRQRIEELTRELKISLPVYFLLTKLDLIAGFTEFFDDLEQEGRAQVWGATFPLAASRSGEAPELLADEFDRLVERLNSRVMLRLEDERDVSRRALIFTFPKQFVALKRPLTQFASEAFATSGRNNKVQLRGVYFTSGTQEGTPIDRMMGSLARKFGLNLRSAAGPSGAGRAYFIQRFLKEVLFKEAGLAGVNRSMEVREALVHGALYAGLCALLAIGVLAFSISYKRNRDYLEETAKATESLKLLPAASPANSLEQILERLDALSALHKLAAKYQQSTPISMRWGLYQGRSVSNTVEDAYFREVNASLVPAVAAHFRGRLSAYAGEPEQLYQTLKAYLMLALPERLNSEQLIYLSTQEWQRVFANDAATRERLAQHFNALVRDKSRVQPTQIDEVTVQQARASLRQASWPVLMYSRLKALYAEEKDRAIDIGQAVGLGADAVFTRRTGRSLSEPVPALYTKPVFKEVSSIGQLEMTKQFVEENWIFGGDVSDAIRSTQLTTQVMQLYEADYIRVWDELLKDLTLRSTSNTAEAAQLWGLLAAPTSPLKGLLELVRTHTSLIEAAAPADITTRAKAAFGGAIGAINKAVGNPQQPQVGVAGASITKHFEPLHRLVIGNPAPIDLTLQKFAALQAVMAEISGIGGPTPLEASSRVDLARKDLETHAKTLPGPLEGIVTRATGKGASVASASISGDFSSRYRQQVVAECLELASGRYPMMQSSGVDLPLGDFARLFAPNGTFDSFFTGTMRTFVDTNRPTWRWKPEAASIGASSAVPAQFQRAERIRQTYFAGASPTPEVRFTVTPDFLDAAVNSMVFEVDGQTLEYRHGPQRAIAMKWPGPKPGLATISVEERGGARPNMVKEGDWALFRLLRDADFRSQGETRFIASFNLGGHTARLVLQTDSSRNPFVADQLLGFSCER